MWIDAVARGRRSCVYPYLEQGLPAATRRRIHASIILSAMAAESYLSYVFIKWKTIYLSPAEADQQESILEDQLRRKYKLTDRLDMVCEFLTEKRFDALAHDDEAAKQFARQATPGVNILWFSHQAL